MIFVGSGCARRKTEKPYNFIIKGIDSSRQPHKEMKPSVVWYQSTTTMNNEEESLALQASTEDYRRQACWLASNFIHKRSEGQPSPAAAELTREHLQRQLPATTSAADAQNHITLAASAPQIDSNVDKSSTTSLKFPVCTQCGAPLQAGWQGTTVVQTLSRKRKGSKTTPPLKNDLILECGTCHAHEKFPGAPVKKRRVAKKAAVPQKLGATRKRRKKCKQSVGLTGLVLTIMLLLNILTSSRVIGCTVDNLSAARVGLYVHIPFCRRRCRYCDFAIVPIGDQSAPDGKQNALQRTIFTNYTDAIVKEIRAIESPMNTVLDTIYFGGGTPSLAPLEMIETIVKTIKEVFSLAGEIEFTMEMDPGTFDEVKLRRFRELGVNRISLGVQSFDDRVLEYLGRFHRIEDIQRSLSYLLRVYGEDCNYSLDLIASLPGVSLADWCTTLSTALQLHPTPRHISVYDLTIEEGTVFGRWYADDEESRAPRSVKNEGPVSAVRLLPSPTESAFQYQYTSGYLRASGYEHYEISSYALPGFRSKHNSLYWGYNTTWFAAGLGATSWVNEKMMARPRALADYFKWVEREKFLAQDGMEQSDNEDDVEDAVLSQLQDVVLKRLRTREGLDLNWVQHQYGEMYKQAILKGANLKELPELVVYEPPFLRLVDSKGFLFSNSLISSVFVALDDVKT